MTTRTTTFTVEGTYPFPVDMLRYDACFPATSDDAVELGASCDFNRRRASSSIGEDKKRRRVKLATNLQNKPTVGRWESFGWRVV
jgi:hypothetical protein